MLSRTAGLSHLVQLSHWWNKGQSFKKTEVVYLTFINNINLQINIENFGLNTLRSHFQKRSIFIYC